jgi:soluble lytic murein transglycosylase-like protein
MLVVFRLFAFLFTMLCFLPCAFADSSDSAKLFTASWIIEKQTKVDASDVDKIVAEAFEQGARHRIDPFLIIALINKESTFNKKARNKNRASGLMQVIPYWHRDKIEGRNIFSVKVNIEVGTQILADCLDKYSQKLTQALKCYSGGAGKKYMRDVALTRSLLRKWVIEQQFIFQQPIYYAILDKDPTIF